MVRLVLINIRFLQESVLIIIFSNSYRLIAVSRVLTLIAYSDSSTVQTPGYLQLNRTHNTMQDRNLAPCVAHVVSTLHPLAPPNMPRHCDLINRSTSMRTEHATTTQIDLTGILALSDAVHSSCSGAQNLS